MAQAYVVIYCESGMEEWVMRSLRKIEGVKEVAAVFGLYDIIVKVEGKDSAALEEIITRKIRKLQYIHTTMTLLVIDEQEKPKG